MRQKINSRAVNTNKTVPSGNNIEDQGFLSPSLLTRTKLVLPLDLTPFFFSHLLSSYSNLVNLNFLVT